MNRGAQNNNSDNNNSDYSMNIHEYQAKQLFATAQIPVAKGQVAHSVAAAEKVADNLGGVAWVVKAQVHSGGRGEAGGVRRVEGKAELDRYVSELMSRPLVTRQSGEKGLPVNAVLIEELCDYERELYLSILVDREREGLMILASPEGGMDIESEAGRARLMQCPIDSVAGLRSHHLRALIRHLQLDKPLHKPFAELMSNLLRLFHERDLSLVEINPLVITRSQGLLALDAKINIDDNALYRQPKILAYRDA
ncbi:MAG: succinate--CoA ligase subunit beta, partial [Gammaproteobacteria bacterium]